MTIKYNFNKTLSEIFEFNHESVVTALNEHEKEIYNFRIIREFSNQDLITMIKRGIALEMLIPFALDVLEENIMPEEDLCAGELLKTTADVSKDYWNHHQEQNEMLIEIIKKNIAFLSEVLSDFSEMS